MKEIPLTQGYVALVDDEDYDRVAKHKWCAAVAPKRTDGRSVVYATHEISKPDGSKTTQVIHRFILDAQRGTCVDHINGNGLDNRRCNLRICTIAENQRNQRFRSGGTSKYKGVIRHKPSGRWRACIRFNRKLIYLGYFTSEHDAARAYNTAALKHFGEFSRINVIDND